MNKNIILYIATSLDGFIADEHGQVEWIQHYSSNESTDNRYDDFINGIDTIVMGNTTYKQIIEQLSPNVWPYESKKCYVFSQTEHNHTDKVTFINSDIANFLQSLAGGNIWVVGGAEITNTLIKNGLIDEYQITLIPVILGKGIRLFKDDNPVQALKLKAYTELNGIPTLSYLCTKSNKE